MRVFRFIHRGPEATEEVRLELDGSRIVFSDGGSARSAVVSRLADGRLSLLFEDGRQVCGRAEPGANGEVEVVTGASRRRIALAEPLRDRIAHARQAQKGDDSDEEIRALMPGRVVEVQAAEGQEVAAGALILVLEAMKMQNEIRCSSAGTVLRVAAQPGTAVEGGALLAVIRSAKT